MARRSALAVAALLAMPGAVLAQAAGEPPLAAADSRTFRIGIVANTVPLAQWAGASLEDGTPHAGQAMREGLEKLGWVEGRNIRILWRSAEGRFDRLASIFNELASTPVDVIVAVGPGSSVAAKTTRSIPIVMVVSAGTLGGELVASLSRPNRNLTGLTVEAEGQEGKRLELLKRTIPTATRIALLEEHGGCSAASNALKDAASTLGLTLMPVGFDSPGQLERAFADASAMRADAILVCDGVWVWRYGFQRTMNALALRYRLPIMHTAAGGADTGGLMAYGVDMMVQYRRVPYYIDRILKGAKPADLPIEQPKTLEFAVNLRTARELGIPIPASVLLQADRVIE